MHPISVPQETLQVVASSGDGAPVLGQTYSIACVGHKTYGGIANFPSPHWLTTNGSFLSTGNTVQLLGPDITGHSSTEIVALFPSLLTSHAGNYTCHVILSSPALTSPIVKNEFLGITIESE